MPAILFVCTANRFRSPIAEAYFVRKLSSMRTSDSWTVASAGTWTPTDLPAHPKAVKAAAKLDLDLSTHRTREVDATLLKIYDLIVVMQQGHKEALELEFPFVRGKVILLGSLANVPGGEIPDAARDNFVQPDAAAGMVCACIDKSFAEIVRLAANQQGSHPPSKT